MKGRTLIIVIIITFMVSAGCAEEHQLGLEVEPEQGGTVEGAGTYEHQVDVTVEAEPSEGYVFVGWKENEEMVSSERSYRFEIVEDKNLVALFEEEVDYKEVALYFGCSEAIETGDTGEYGYVRPFIIEIIDHEDPEKLLRVTMEKLIKGPDPDKEEFSAVVHDTVEILDLEINEDGVAAINLSAEMFGDQWPGGSLAGNVFIQSVTWTATQFPDVDEVMVLVEGQYWDDGHRIWDRPKTPGEKEEALPAEIEEWIDYSRDIWLAQAREYEGSLYLLATFGKQPSGGYNVEITDVIEETDQLTVAVKFTEPGEDEVVTQAITYPYDLNKIDPTELPVNFVAEGDFDYVPMLHSLDWLPPLVAGSEDIRILFPAPGDTVSRQFAVEGIELVFEGAIVYSLSDSAGNELDSGIATGHGYKWGHFTADLTVPEETESGEELLVELYSESPRDGSVENLVELDLVLE